MFIKYFEYLFCISVGIIIVIAIILLLRNFKLRHLQKLSRINILKKQQKSAEKCLFSAEIIDSCVVLLWKAKSKQAKTALAYLAAGRTEKAAAFLQKKQQQTALLLLAHTQPQYAYKHILQQKKQWLKSKKYAPYLPLLASLCFDMENAENLPEKINPQKLTVSARAVYNFVSATAYLKNADMMSASKAGSAALNFYKKRHRPIEEAACYLLLAEIYRISCVNDIAQTMIESARKIYKGLNLQLFTAQATAVLGMLMLFENRQEEAESYFNDALNGTSSDILSAEIKNQLSLLETARQNYNQARRNCEEALNLHSLHHNERGTAFSLQLKAHIEFGCGHYKKAVASAGKAASLYKKQHNFSAYSESLYILAEAHCKMKHFIVAEKNLREILDNNRLHPNSFHTANAYSLLGLIYLQTGNYQRAKVLFQQSLHLEQSCERSQAIAADYANLALIENIGGDKTGAKSNLEIAREFAEKSEDKQLLEIIEKKISDLTNK
jgi:tetratricopeptide (TPR) repeat protein